MHDAYVYDENGKKTKTLKKAGVAVNVSGEKTINKISPSIITKIIQKNTPFSHRKRYILLNLEIISFYKLSWANCPFDVFIRDGN